MQKKEVLTILIVAFIGIFAISKIANKNRAQSLHREAAFFNRDNENDNNQNYHKQTTTEQRKEDTKELNTSRHNSITEAVNKVQPAVVSVNIIKTQIVKRYVNPFENPFFGFFHNHPFKRKIQGIGSGVIFSEDGYILTNEHVVQGATEIKIILTDGRNFEAEIVGMDEKHDIAILKVDADNLPVARLGTSSDLIIGEWAIAVGNPYGFLIKDSKPSVSVGVVSAFNRNFSENRDGKIYKGMIQTDAAINPGNSGGPLVNIYGEVIGINSFIVSETGSNIGIGFASPIDKIKKSIEEILKYGKIRQVWFGFKVQDINPLIASYMNLESQDGVIIAYLEDGGPADKAGVKKGDIIIKINNTDIKNTDDVELAIADIAVGDTIRLVILRDGKEIKTKIKAIEFKK